MKTKKRFYVAELLPAQSLWKNYLIIFSLLILGLSFNSCKKDLLITNASSISKKDINLDIITYKNFLVNINTNSLGFLKSKLSTNTSKKLLSINDNNSLGNLSIYTDSVQRIINKSDTSYVFKMALSSPRAITFRNFTIQSSKGKISAFITTYTPTKEWIDARKKNKKIEFKGDISFASIDLDEKNLLQGLAVDQSSSNGGKVMSIGNKKMLINTVCDTYIIYNPVPYGCSYGNHMPWDNECAWNRGQTVPEGDFRGGYNWVPELKVFCTDYYTPDPVPGGGGGGSTPTPPGGYKPCDVCDTPPLVSFKNSSGGVSKLAIVPPNCCEEDNGGLYPIVIPFNENDPIILPLEWDLEYPQSWFAEEDQLNDIATLYAQQNAPPSSMIPEMYYINGLKVDMLNATPLTGRRTALGFPSNHRYFWKEVISQKPQMFSAYNRAEILAGRSPIVDDQWIRYNPTHKSYKYNPLRHHHEGQGRYAFAIPEKVHQKWSAILHQYKQTGKIPRIRPKINTLFGTLQVFTFLTDLQTGNPDAWVNWFGPHQDIGKIYKHPEKNVYFEITKQTTIKNTAGKVIRAKVTYDVYDDYIWDEDENRYMGIIKLGTFTEYIDVDLGKTYQNPEQEWS